LKVSQRETILKTVRKDKTYIEIFCKSVFFEKAFSELLSLTSCKYPVKTTLSSIYKTHNMGLISLKQTQDRAPKRI